MLSAGIALLAGSITACLLPWNIDVFWLSYLPFCLFFVVTNPRWRVAWLILASFLWTSLFIYWQLEQRLPVELNNKRLAVVGEVITIPKLTSGNSSYLFRPHAIEDYHGRLPGLMKLYWRKSPDSLAAGQVWRLKVKIKRPHGYQNPGGFDYERWLFSKGIGATGYVINAAENRLLHENGVSLNHYRQRINERIERYCADCDNLGLIQALALGYRGNIQHKHRSLLQQTGTAHLIAISGLHIGIIAAVFYFLGLKFWALGFYRYRLNRREFALLLSWVAAFGYSLASGFDLPAQRAMIMLTVIFASVWMRIPLNLLNSIFVALVVVLIVSPLAVLSESFWLSFSALFVIALGSRLLQGQQSRFRQLVFIQLLFSLLFIPLSIVIFNQVHLASFMANLVAVPLISFIVVPLNFLLITLLWLPEGWLQGLYQGVDGLLGLLTTYLQWLQDLGLHARDVADIQIWTLVLLVLLSLLILKPFKVLGLQSWLLLLPLLIVWPVSPRPEAGLQVAVLDVGMGNAIVVKTRQHSLVYDFGPGYESGFSLGEWVLMPYLQHQGIDRLDRIVISHSDQDHMGGLYAIQSRLQHDAVFSGTPEQVKKRLPQLGPVRDCHQQPPWVWDGIRFTFLAAPTTKKESDNNRSCVLLIENGNSRVLIAGDIESDQEYKLLNSYAEKMPSTILIAPHHGSLTSSSSAFVKAVSPNAVVFTTGYLNRWGFPRPEVLSRYQKVGAEIYRTDQDGAVSIHCFSNDCSLQRYRSSKPRIWY